ncbi:MAG: galactose-1-phosphate uridylyltransferase, partial [Acidobacteriota bacterium]|nr:galactose-1-phosphate uridylyltransferase [Acidobacteriota bacterium]
FEMIIISTRHFGGIGVMNIEEQEQLADMIRQVSRIYDGLFQSPFPYTMGLHQQPCNCEDSRAWHFHVHYFPPLLRASVRKFMAGFELLATPQRDVTPEWAAEQLRKAAAVLR